MTLDRARAIIDRDFARPLTVTSLARTARMSRAHFIRAFAAAYGQPPHAYLRDRRLARARDLLVRTPAPILDICIEVGFRSLGSFSTTFKRLTGETPGQWRARRRRTPMIPGCFVRMYRLDR